jgi:hypothetical protein
VPLSDGAGAKQSGEPYGTNYAGCYVVNANNSQRPEIVDISRRPIIEESEIYSGLYVYVAITLYPYASNGRKGVGFSLGPVLKYKDGEPMGGKLRAVDVFAGLFNEHVEPDAPPWK